MVRDWLRGRKESPPLTQEGLGQELRKSVEDTDRLNRLNQHKRDVLGICEKWATSYVTHGEPHTLMVMPRSPYTWGNVSLLGICVQESPEKERYYNEAREDLRCWPKVYEKLKHAELLMQKLNDKTKSVREKALKAIREVMEQYDLKEWYNGGGAQERKGSYDQSILESLILRPLSEGEKYAKPIVELQNEWICLLNPTTKISEQGLVSGIKLENEAKKLIYLFSNFETALEQVMKEPNFADLCAQIKEIQNDFRKAEEAYGSFKTDLARTAIKDIIPLGFPNGGKCHICLGLRA